MSTDDLRPLLHTGKSFIKDVSEHLSPVMMTHLGMSRHKETDFGPGTLMTWYPTLPVFDDVEPAALRWMVGQMLTCGS